MELTKGVAYKAIAEFFSAEKPFVLFGTGTSCALDLSFGMPALEGHLRTELSAGLNNYQALQWQLVIDTLDARTHDFESAMDFIKDDELTNRIVETTAKFVAYYDAKYAYQIISGSVEWPAGRLIKKLVETLPETDRQLHLATPNYDLLAEYSFVRDSIPYLTGFSGGFCRQFDWSEAKKTVRFTDKSLAKTKQPPRLVEKKHIRLHKPHGSLNTFDVESRMVECDGWIVNKPDGVTRAMITPGTAKYQRLHQDRSRLAEYDRAVSDHSSFLFLGFGFNDSQLVNNTFRHKLEQNQCSGLVITRDFSPQIGGWLNSCPNMWVVCKQETSDSTRVFNSKFDDWLLINDKELWRFDRFTQEFLGG